jgi:hypothetical protein
MEVPRMSGVADILARIAEIEREILSPVTGKAVKAYANIPQSVPPSDMPCFVNFPGALTENSLFGSDEVGREFTETRNYNLVFYLDPVGTGTNQEKSGLLVPYFELVLAKFGSYPRLKVLPEIQDAVITADSGTSQVTYNGDAHYGIRFVLRVTRVVRRLLSSTD